MNRYSIEARYPGEWEEISRAEAERAVMLARAVCTAARRLLAKKAVFLKAPTRAGAGNSPGDGWPCTPRFVNVNRPTGLFLIACAEFSEQPGLAAYQSQLFQLFYLPHPKGSATLNHPERGRRPATLVRVERLTKTDRPLAARAALSPSIA